MFNVLSFDKRKIEISSDADGKIIVRKRTSNVEYKNIILAHQHFQKYHPMFVHQKRDDIFISIAEISGWNQNTNELSTFFCQGSNLEEILRMSFGQMRNDLINFLRKIFKIFKSKGFLWGDFAPRNMIWNKDKKILWLVDFERHLRLKDGPVNKSKFSRYIRNYAMEEFSCFLNDKEQKILFNGFLKEDCSVRVPVNKITSKRKKSLLRCLFGEKMYYSLQEVRKAEDIMVFVATPFKVGSIYFFPMDIFDLIGSKGGPNEYAKTAVAIKDLKESKRHVELKRCAENL